MLNKVLTLFHNKENNKGVSALSVLINNTVDPRVFVSPCNL